MQSCKWFAKFNFRIPKASVWLRSWLMVVIFHAYMQFFFTLSFYVYAQKSIIAQRIFGTNVFRKVQYWTIRFLYGAFMWWQATPSKKQRVVLITVFTCNQLAINFSGINFSFLILYDENKLYSVLQKGVVRESRASLPNKLFRWHLQTPCSPTLQCQPNMSWLVYTNHDLYNTT